MEIQAFQPQRFWSITVDYEVPNAPGGNQTVLFEWDRSRLYDQFASLVLYKRVLEQPQAVVKAVNATPRSRRKPLPLATIELQKRASRHLRLGAEETMRIAEKLYQSGFISYPRTETEVFKKTIDLQSKVRMFEDHPDFGRFSSGLLNPQVSQI